MQLKAPFRFAHTGVRGELRALHAWLNEVGDYEFGSSGDGGLTVRARTRTAYIRKQRGQSGWTVTIWTSEQDEQGRDFERRERVIQWVVAALHPTRS